MEADRMMRITILPRREIVSIETHCLAEGQWDGCLSLTGSEAWPRSMFERHGHYLQQPSEALHCYLLMGVHDGNHFLTSELSLLAFTLAFSLSR